MIYNKTLELSDYIELENEVSLFKHYNQLYGQWALVSTEHRHWEYAMVYKCIREYGSLPAKILEIGSAAGVGQGTPLSLALAIDGNIVYASDIVDHGQEATIQQKELVPSVSNRLFWAKEDATALSFADETFDIVYSISVIEHIQEDLQAVTEAIRVLKPNGYLIFTCDFSNTQKPLIQDQLRLYSREYLENTLFPAIAKYRTFPIDNYDFTKNEENVWWNGSNYNFAIVSVKKRP